MLIFEFLRRKAALLVLPFILGLGIPASAIAQNTAELSDGHRFLEDHRPLVGLYKSDDEFIVIGQIPEARVFYIQRLKTGDMRFLRATANNEWVYSPTRNATDTISGRVTFNYSQGSVPHLVWTEASSDPRLAQRITVTREPFEIATQDGASIAGELITPKGSVSSAVLLLVPQSNRFNIFDVGMWALSRGIGVAVYDQRNAPLSYSTGPEPVGMHQEQMAVYAKDAIAVFDFLHSHSGIDPKRIAIAGWSGGGLTAAFVAAQRPELAGYINIAGDASYGFEQASHLYISRLFREGFSDSEIEEARKFVSTHFGTASGTVSWSEYQSQLEQVKSTDWYQYLSSRYAIPYSDPDRVLEIGERQSRWPPGRVYSQVSTVPTLGVFFEWDHSSAPSSPLNFLSALHEAGNGSVQISVIPNANHGGFLVKDVGYRFDTERLTGRSPFLIRTIADWLHMTLNERQVETCAH